MSYEIPQELQYKERILFGLTLEQVGYALGFGLSIWQIVRLPLDITFRITFATIVGVLALLFMFCNAAGNIRRWISWWRNRELGLQQVKAFVNVHEGADSLGVQNKKRIAVLRVHPMNFRIKPSEDQNAIISAFQKFLNGIDFRVQIIMCTSSVNLSNYFRELDTQLASANPSLRRAFSSHKLYLHRLMQERSMNRMFYLVIPETDDGLSSALQICQEFLKNTGLRTSQVPQSELHNLWTRVFNQEVLPSKIMNKSNHYTSWNV